MDLFSEFEKRRGFNPPIAVHKKNYELPRDTWQVLALAFSGRLQYSCLIPVLPQYQIVFGEAIWLCPDEDKAQDKQRDGQSVAFTPDELMDIIPIAAQDLEGAASIVAAKRAFGGIITR